MTTALIYTPEYRSAIQECGMFTICVGLDLCGPFIAEQAHAHEIDILPAVPDMRTPAPFLDKSAGPVGPIGAVIIPVDGQINLAHVPQPEAVIQQKGDGL